MKIDKKTYFANFIFLLLTFLYIYTFIKIGKFNVQSDASFHLQRANEIYQNLKSGSLFTFISTHSFGNSGVASFLFYPTVPLYILAFFRFIFNPITAIYLWIGLFMFLTQSIAFFAMKRFSGNTFRAFIFAQLYTIAPYHLYLGFWNSVWGEFTAYTFIPLIFLGIYEILWKNQKKSWVILAIGMALLCSCHVVTTYIAAGLCLILFLVRLFLSKIEKQQIFSLIKAIGLTILLAGWQYIPFLTDYIGKGIHSPEEHFQYVASFGDLISNSLSNSIQQTDLGIILVVTLIIGLSFRCIQDSKTELSIYILGSFLGISASGVIPWDLLAKNQLILHTLGNIQFPYRLLSFASLFLSVSASLVIYNLFKNKLTTNSSKNLVILIVSLFSIVLFYGAVQPTINLISSCKTSNLLKESHSVKRQGIPQPILINKYDYKDIMQYNVIWGNEDYYPERAVKQFDSIINGVSYIQKKPIKLDVKVRPNNEIFTLNEKQNVKLNTPILAYARSYVKVNGKNYKYNISNRGTIEVNLNKGRNIVQVGYKPSVLYYISFVISLITWLVLFIKFLI